MSQKNQKIKNRFEQMSKQEELIQRKKIEILDKQRTAQLARAVAAAQSLQAKQKANDNKEEQDILSCSSGTEAIEHDNEQRKAESTYDESGVVETNAIAPITAVLHNNKKNNRTTGKITFALKRGQPQAPMAEEPAPKILNSFCNDGSFLENFKKILEKADQPKPLLLPENFVNIASVSGEVNANMNTIDMEKTLAQNESIQEQEGNNNHNIHQHQQQQLLQPEQNFVETFAFNPLGFLNQHHHTLHMLHEPILAMQHLPISLTQPPPPPPPPLYMIPPPEPLQVNTIPAPKEFNLSAIPKPQVNLDAIQMPQQQDMQQQQQKPQDAQGFYVVLSDNIVDCEQKLLTDLPTSLEMLIASVAVNGDDYEDKLCHMHKSNLHPTMW